MKQELIDKLLSRIEMKEYYPTRHKKAAKKDPVYLHVSNHYFEKVDPDTKLVSMHRIGITYRK